MRNRTSVATTSGRRLVLPALVVGALAAVFAPGWHGWSSAAAVTDIATLPVFSSTPPAIQVKPNVFFIMDDSGSMAWTHMPDQADDFAGRYGFSSSHCNGIYYNPNITYKPPVDASGNSYSNQSFTAAQIDGYGIVSTSTVNLSSSFRAAVNGEVQATITSDAYEPAYYYIYKGTQTTERQKNYYDTNSIFYRECRSTVGSTTKIDGTNAVNTLFEKKVVSATSGPGGTDERTNFANWYSYYRTRVNMMKTATGLAFKDLDDKFRVGYMSINNNASPDFLNITDFNTTQKSAFYTQLYKSRTGSSTPIRGALSKAGRMYANKISTINSRAVVDPVQYSCQQNYTILSTDGTWNEADSLVVQLDGTTQIGNQDGALSRPYNDGSQVTTTTVTTYTKLQDRVTTDTASTRTRTWSRTSTVIGAACTASVAPTNTATAPMSVSNNRQGAVGYSTSNPFSGRCYNLTNNAWFCRNDTNNGTIAVGASSVTDSTNKTWYLVSNISGKTGCISSNTAFGTGYSTTSGVCPSQSTPGSRVTVTPQTQTNVLTGFSSTTTDRYKATQTTTQTTINGVAGPVGPLTPATPSYNIDTSVPQTYSESSGGETCGGQPAPCPSAAGTWSSGTPTVNNVCVATADLPVAGVTTPVLAGTVNTGAASNTVINQLADLAPVVDSTSVGTGGVANTLADVAAYYYATNLRTTALGNCTGPTIAPSTTPNNLCEPNTVPATGQDTATWQHMTTSTLGLGVRGRMVFSSTYLTDTSGDYWDVLKGNTATATNCTWRDTITVTGGPCNWPVPGSNRIENTDDLWHAAVNGRGNYFSATDPATLTAGLTSTLKAIVNAPRPGTASAAATTNPKITSGNNFQFSSYFKTVEWSGELIRQTMNLTDGSVPDYNHLSPDPTAYDWSASNLLNARDYTDRKIYISTGSSLALFNWTNLSATQKSYFTTPHITTAAPQYATVLTGLSQFCSTGTNCLSTANQTAAAGENLVNFLRGERVNEEGPTPDNSKFYRRRGSRLGDIVSAQPQFVGPPSRYYADSGYADFKIAQAARASIVYTASNDGMVHAFNATTGQEAWAYIPSFVLPRLYTLADKSYADKHQYSVEGTPIAGDICPKAPTQTCSASEWRTILVGGLNGGGTGYYALDVTDPANPALLWEFTHPNMGYSFGKPQITKLTNGTWVVLLTSGYNNCPRTVDPACVKNGSGDGLGYLYVLNASTGAQMVGSPISTGAGAVNSPSGFGQITAQADSNNVTRRVYGGDLLGNLWRFSIESGSFGVHKLAVFKDSTGALQPITVRPQVTTINGSPVVYVGTGRYLGTSDVGGSPKNSFYAVKDDLTTTTTYDNPRTYTTFIGQRATDGVCPSGVDISVCLPGQKVRTVSQISGSANSNLATQNGWFLDFPSGAGEIQFTDPKLALGTLAFSTSVPTASTAVACTPNTGGSDGIALGYMLDYLTGGAVGTSSGVIATSLGAGVATAPQIAQLPNGTVIAKYRLSTGQEVSVPLRFGATGAATRRISWRELISE